MVNQSKYFFGGCVVKYMKIKRHQYLVQKALFCAGIHRLKARLPPRDPKSIRAQPFDPIPPVAEQISSQWWLLCFDEFQVTSLSTSNFFKGRLNQSQTFFSSSS